MNSQRVPRQSADLDSAPDVAARRRLYEQALFASAQPGSPQGAVALVLVDVSLAPGSERLGEHVLAEAMNRLGTVLNRRLRSVDLLVRSGQTELAVLLALATIGVAGAFSERLRQPIEQALREMTLASDIIVGMGLAANPPDAPWHPDELIAVADFRMLAARRSARASAREWALAVDGVSVPRAQEDAAHWPAAAEITSHSGL